MSNLLTRISPLMLAAALAACGGDGSLPPTASSHLGHGSPSLTAATAGTEGALVAQVRRATARFQRIDAAFA